MTPEDARRLPGHEVLAYWMRERDAIRVRRSLGLPPPWTGDPVLRDWRYCNVRRMDDAVSDWLYRAWYRPYRDHPNMLAAAALARHFNVPDTLRNIQADLFHGPPGQRAGTKFNTCKAPDWPAIKHRVRVIKADGYTVFNAAYMVRGIGEVDKTEMVVERVVRPLHEKPPELDTSSMQKCHAALLPYWGFSDFMAGQVVADLRWALSGSWKDRQTWAPVGPGSARGLARLTADDRNHAAAGRYARDPARFLADLLDLRSKTEPLLPRELAGRLELMDWQNALCECDKMLRVVLGEGRPKQRYTKGR